MTLSEELVWRGFVSQTTFEDVTELDKRKFTVYLGNDPTADSLQVGNLATLMLLRRFMDHGHKVFILTGGATGMIGDPGGKDSERNLQTIEQVEQNAQKISAQINKLMSGQEFTMVNNYDWFKSMKVLDFLRDIGKHFSMTPLVQRDYIANRMGEGGAGISYTEFSYTLLQGYDFYHLNQKYGVDLQVCGADQWGNCLSGVDLIRRKTGKEAHVYAGPIVVNRATGKKFGKSEEGAVFLSEEKTTVYKFYQFWLNVDDQAAIEYLKLFTLLNKDQVDMLENEQRDMPGARPAQKALAYEITMLVHGKDRADSVVKISDALFGSKDYSKLSKQDFEMLAGELPIVDAKSGADINDVLVDAMLARSKSEARRFVADGAVYINGKQISGDAKISKDDSIEGYLIIRRGKNTQALVKIA